MNTDVYIANPTLMQGKITKNTDISIKNPNIIPVTNPKFTKINKLLTKTS